jgi:hypothetical protein
VINSAGVLDTEFPGQQGSEAAQHLPANTIILGTYPFSEDGLVAVPAVQHVINGAGVLDTQFPGQQGSEAAQHPPPNTIILGTDPSS